MVQSWKSSFLSDFIGCGKMELEFRIIHSYWFNWIIIYLYNFYNQEKKGNRLSKEIFSTITLTFLCYHTYTNLIRLFIQIPWFQSIIKSENYNTSPQAGAWIFYYKYIDLIWLSIQIPWFQSIIKWENSNTHPQASAWIFYY